MADRLSLVLFRHAKSDWEAEFATDHERPLAKRGRKAAASMGRVLQSAGQLPALVLCSTATRTRDTLELAIAAGGWRVTVSHQDDLYDASPEALLALVRRAPDQASPLMLVGHEPSLSELIRLCIGGGNVRVPTAAMARIDFPATRWSEIVPATGELIWLLQPRFFGDAAG